MKKILYLIAFMLLFSATAFPKPADRRLRTLKQSDGTTLTYRQLGDEFFHYYSTADGKPLVLEQGKSYVCIIPSNRDIILQ